MLPQHDDLLEIIELCRERGKPVAIGGPAATSVPHFYAKATFQVLGEVEDVISDFVAAWEAGAREGVFQAKKFESDVRKTPIPRFDLLKFDRYLYIGVLHLGPFSRHVIEQIEYRIAAEEGSFQLHAPATI